jgi:hypothetical protein
MGSNLAYDLANDELGLDLETAIGWHLQGNHYPPVPLSMVEPCIQAIEAYWDMDIDREIPMPEGVTYRGQNTSPAWAIIEQHHLDAWCEESYTDEE